MNETERPPPTSPGFDGEEFSGLESPVLIQYYLIPNPNGSGQTRYHSFVSSILDKIRKHHHDRTLLTFEQSLTAEVTPMWSEPLSLRDLVQWSRREHNNLAARFYQHPKDLLLYAEEVLRKIIVLECTAEQSEVCPRIFLSLHDNPNITGIGKLNPYLIDCAVTIEGIVIRATGIKPLMAMAAFQCRNRTIGPGGETTACNYVSEEKVIDRRVTEPQQCPKCQKNVQELSYHKSKYQNRQVLKIQDLTSSDTQLSQNTGIIAYVHDPLVDAAKPGDRVQITGIYRTSQQRVRPTQQIVNITQKTYFDVIHIAPIERPDKPLVSVTEQDFMALKNRSRLMSLFAPGISLLDQVKLGLLCSIVGGSTNAPGPQSRTTLHVLLCGDPATAKSQLLGAVKSCVQRAQYVCGRGSSAAGLTASVVRDADTNEFLLEPGAVVVADRGICLIDEFDKVDEGARVALNEVMEQQTVSVAKAGIVCSLNARTSIIASANPIASRFDKSRSIMENLNMPLGLLSRFDLVYLLTDPDTTDYDAQLATSLTGMWSDEASRSHHASTENRARSAQNQLLASFLHYATNNVQPTFTVEAKDMIVHQYKELRSRTNSVVVTPRLLQSIMRISAAIAKLDLSAVVAAEHVAEATALIVTSTATLEHRAEDDATSVARKAILDAVGPAGPAGIAESELFQSVLAARVDRTTFGSIVRSMISERILISRPGVQGQILSTATQ